MHHAVGQKTSYLWGLEASLVFGLGESYQHKFLGIVIYYDSCSILGAYSSIISKIIIVPKTYHKHMQWQV